MSIKKILDLTAYIDHTELSPTATWSDIKKLVNEAIKYNAASICIPPYYIRKVKDEYKDAVKICTVIGFPLGYNSSEAKYYETKLALTNGADEIDFVINIGEAKAGNFEAVKNEIIEMRKITFNHCLKVIIETCYLTKEEIIKLSNIISECKADYVKTSTGYGTEGATIENVKLIKNSISQDTMIKAAGGIRDLDSLRVFIELGCDRIGSTSIIRNLESNLKI